MTDPVIGYKLLTWRNGRLCSLVYRSYWSRRNRLLTVNSNCGGVGSRFELMRKKARHYAEPALNCTCGIYAVSNLDHLEGFYFSYEVMVVVRVAGFGTVINAERGWRAGHARITGLVAAFGNILNFSLADNLVDDLSKRFSIPVIDWDGGF